MMEKYTTEDMAIVMMRDTPKESPLCIGKSQAIQMTEHTPAMVEAWKMAIFCFSFIMGWLD